MIILDGKKVKEKKKDYLKEEINNLSFSFNKKPKLCILQVGDNAISNIYINQKINFGKEIGAEVELIKTKENISGEELFELISKLNNDQSVNGIIIQLPIPKYLNKLDILNTINPQKDIDGLGSKNIYELVNNGKGFVPATAKGFISLLKEYNIDVLDKHVVVIGRSLLVGKSLSLALLNNDATVTICHSKTKNLNEIIKSGDIIVSAVGMHGILNDENVLESQIIVDVGISKNSEGKTVGDAYLIKIKPKAFSPVPGGVGQMTVLSLFENLLIAFKEQNNQK